MCVVPHLPFTIHEYPPQKTSCTFMKPEVLEFTKLWDFFMPTIIWVVIICFAPMPLKELLHLLILFHANNYLSCDNMFCTYASKRTPTPFDSFRLPIVKWMYVWVHNHWKFIIVFNNCRTLAFTLNKWCTYHNWYPKLYHQKF